MINRGEYREGREDGEGGEDSVSKHELYPGKRTDLCQPPGSQSRRGSDEAATSTQ
jgi:hypothetical protein